ncbi:hypothetical protein [Caulobacter sp. LARHSG274]
MPDVITTASSLQYKVGYGDLLSAAEVKPLDRYVQH